MLLDRTIEIYVWKEKNQIVSKYKQKCMRKWFSDAIWNNLTVNGILPILNICFFVLCPTKYEDLGFSMNILGTYAISLPF